MLQVPNMGLHHLTESNPWTVYMWEYKKTATPDSIQDPIQSRNYIPYVIGKNELVLTNKT